MRFARNEGGSLSNLNFDAARLQTGYIHCSRSTGLVGSSSLALRVESHRKCEALFSRNRWKILETEGAIRTGQLWRSVEHPQRECDRTSPARCDGQIALVSAVQNSTQTLGYTRRDVLDRSHALWYDLVVPAISRRVQNRHSFPSSLFPSSTPLAGIPPPRLSSGARPAPVRLHGNLRPLAAPATAVALFVLPLAELFARLVVYAKSLPRFRLAGLRTPRTTSS